MINLRVDFRLKIGATSAKMNQPNLEKLVNKLRYNVKPRRKFRQPQGPEGRLLKFRKILTALIKYERLELNYPRGDEARGYVDQVRSLFSDYFRIIFEETAIYYYYYKYV